MMASRFHDIRNLPFPDQPVFSHLINDPSSAQIQLWMAQARRDHGMISDHEMSIVEGVAGAQARKSIAMFNPFTGEYRKVEF